MKTRFAMANAAVPDAMANVAQIQVPVRAWSTPIGT